MAETDIPEGVTTEVGRSTASATTTVAAEPAAVFDFVRRPENHAAISGDESVKGSRFGPDELALGDRFGMDMKMFGVPYRMSSKVVELEEGRRIAWCHLGGHRWRWEVEPDGEGGTRVTETFDMTTSKVPPVLRLAGYPRRHEPNLARSVANVARLVTEG